VSNLFEERFHKGLILAAQSPNFTPVGSESTAGQKAITWIGRTPRGPFGFLFCLSHPSTKPANTNNNNNGTRRVPPQPRQRNKRRRQHLSERQSTIAELKSSGAWRGGLGPGFAGCGCREIIFVFTIRVASGTNEGNINGPKMPILD